MKQHNISGTSWNYSTFNTAYEEKFSYDANGNIKTLLRKGANISGMPLAMDNLKYFYYYTNTSNARATYDPTLALPGNVKSLSNQLAHVTDTDPAGNYTDDIDNQTAGNYDYDNSGNLIKDVKDSITGINWTVYGKIKQITKSSGVVINYGYDVSGNRISKEIIGAPGGTTKQFYIRDAQGNTMAIYNGKTSYVEWSEQHLYGSSRLGIWNYGKQVPLLPVGVSYDSMMVGSFNYELTNHLGNVLSTISDKKVGVSVGGVLVDYYNAEMLGQNDYYAFGSLMPGRKYSVANTNYRYGFNGKENDKEVKGEGNQQDYGMRIYDLRLGRFLSVDPLYKTFPFYSPYHFAGNSPIANIDLDGGEPKDFKGNWQYHNMYNPKTGSRNGKTLFVDDPGLGYIAVEAVYDNVTKQTWFIHQDNQANFYYLKNLNSDHETLRYTKNQNHKIIGGRFEKFDTQDEVYRKNTNEFLDNLSVGFAGGIAGIIAAPVLPYISSTLVTTSGLSGVTFQTEAARRIGAAVADASIQGFQIATNRQDKFNYGGTLGSLLTSSPIGSAVWTTAGQAANTEVKNSSDLLSKFTFNLGGNYLGNKMTRGLIVNSPYSKAKDPIANAINSYLGNVGGGAGGFIGSSYNDLNTSAKNGN